MSDDFKTLTPEKVNSMSYVEFISLLRETNRCPGGKDTIRKIIQNTYMNSDTKVLEIGSNTGFTSLEIARTVKCQVIGLEPIRSAVNEARRELSGDITKIQNLVEFVEGSAYDIPFPNDTFDVLVTGGATSFMSDKHKALDEYYRVLKPWGFLAIANLCYFKTPPQEVVRAVSEIIGVEIPAWTQNDWLNLFKKNELFEVYFYEPNTLTNRTQNELEEYVDLFIKKDHIAGMNQDTVRAIKERWLAILEVFNENHKYLGYIITIFRKRLTPEEPSIF